MLVSGGQILAIDRVYPDNQTITGDGVKQPLSVNAEFVATKELVSDTSAVLQENINELSDNIHETVISAADSTIDSVSAKLEDGTIVWKIKSTSNTHIVGVDPISVEQHEDGWYVSYTGQQSEGRIYYAGQNIDIYQDADQNWYISATVPDVSNFITSATNENAGKTLVLKDNVWIPIENTSIVVNSAISAVSSFVTTNSAEILDVDTFITTNSAEILDIDTTVKTNSATWNESTAFGAVSGKFVTSGIDVIHEADTAYVLVNDNDVVSWSGVDLSELGRVYPISSITPDLISAAVTTVNDTPTYVLSAKKPEEFMPYEISGSMVSAWTGVDSDKNYYLISGANVKGENGVITTYDSDNNEWTVALEEHTAGYLYADNDDISNFKTDQILTKSISIKSGVKKFSIDADTGAITIPDDVSKFTICINETVSDNINDSHVYLLNAIELYYVTENDTATSITKARNFYPTETGTSNVSISTTIDHAAHPSVKYYVKYIGSDSIATNAMIQLDISIIEEIISIDKSESAATIYTSEEPIFKTESDKFWLSYDKDVIKVTQMLNQYGENRMTLTINRASIDTPGVIDAEQFKALENVIDSRVVENFPVAAITNAELQLRSENSETICQMHTFRPVMNFTLGLNTEANLYVTSAGTGSGSKITIGVADANKKLIWLSESGVALSNGRFVIHGASVDTTNNINEITSDKLYYVVIFGYRLGAARIAGISIPTMNANVNTLAVGKVLSSGDILSSITLDYSLTNVNEVTEIDGRKPYVSFYNAAN